MKFRQKQEAWAHLLKINHHGRWEAFCKRNVNAIKTAMHSFLLWALFLSVHDYLMCASHGQPFTVCILTDRKQKVHEDCLHLSMFGWMWVYRPPAFTQWRPEKSQTGERCLGTSPRRGCPQERDFRIKGSKYFEVQLSGWKDHIHHAFIFPWSQSAVLECKNMDTVERFAFITFS